MLAERSAPPLGTKQTDRRVKLKLPKDEAIQRGGNFRLAVAELSTFIGSVPFVLVEPDSAGPGLRSRGRLHVRQILCVSEVSQHVLQLWPVRPCLRGQFKSVSKQRRRTDEYMPDWSEQGRGKKVEKKKQKKEEEEYGSNIDWKAEKHMLAKEDVQVKKRKSSEYKSKYNPTQIYWSLLAEKRW